MVISIVRIVNTVGLRHWCNCTTHDKRAQTTVSTVPTWNFCVYLHCFAVTVNSVPTDSCCAYREPFSVVGNGINLAITFRIGVMWNSEPLLGRFWVFRLATKRSYGTDYCAIFWLAWFHCRPGCQFWHYTVPMLVYYYAIVFLSIVPTLVHLSRNLVTVCPGLPI